jgi:hypothetical protein
MKKTLTTLSLALAMVPFTFAAQTAPPAAGSSTSASTTAKPATKTKKHTKAVTKKNSTAAPKTASGTSK